MRITTLSTVSKKPLRASEENATKSVRARVRPRAQPRLSWGISLRHATDYDRLRLGVEVERLFAVLLAVAARLPAAERQLVVHLRAGVDPGVAGLDSLGGLAGAV